MAEYSRIQVKISSEVEAWGNVGYGTDDYKVPTLVYGNTQPDASGSYYNALIDSSGHLQVDIVSAGSLSNTQYTEGDTDASITGTAIMWEDAADTLVVASAAKPLPVEITDASVAVTGTFWQATQPVSIAQDIMLGTDFSNVFGAASLISATPAVKVEEQGTVTVDLGLNNDVTVTGLVTANAGTNLNTSLLALETGGNLATIAGDTTAIQTSVELIDDTVYTDGTGTPSKGIAIMGSDGTNPQLIAVDATGNLQVDILNASLAVTGTFWQATQPVSIAASVAVTNAGTFAVQDSQDVMLGTDFSNVLGTASLILATQADDVVNTTDTLLTSAFGYAFDGTTWDRMRGDATNGLLVNLGTNNDITLATLPDTAGGDLATISGDTTAIQTATELIDDTVYVDDADWTADTSKHILVGGVTQAVPTANTDGDVTPLITNGLRELRMAALESDLATAATSHVKKYYTNAGAVTDGIIWSPSAGKRWYLTLLAINVSAAATVTIEDDLAGGDSAVYKAELAANSGVVLPFTDVPMFSGEDAADLIITTSAGNVYVTAVGYEI